MSRFLDEEKKVVSTHAEKNQFPESIQGAGCAGLLWRSQDSEAVSKHELRRDFVTCNTLQEIVHHRHTAGSGWGAMASVSRGDRQGHMTPTHCEFTTFCSILTQVQITVLERQQVKVIHAGNLCSHVWLMWCEAVSCMKNGYCRTAHRFTITDARVLHQVRFMSCCKSQTIE